MKRTLQLVAIATVASCLIACGGNDNTATPATTTSGTGSTSTTGTGVVAGMLDSFGTFVAALIGTTSETGSPVSIDSVAVTTPNNTQPAPITN